MFCVTIRGDDGAKQFSQLLSESMPGLSVQMYTVTCVFHWFCCKTGIMSGNEHNGWCNSAVLSFHVSVMCLQVKV